MPDDSAGFPRKLAKVQLLQPWRRCGKPISVRRASGNRLVVPDTCGEGHFAVKKCNQVDKQSSQWIFPQVVRAYISCAAIETPTTDTCVR
mmetsp:Transcript_38840/g.84763  ORF Transcript_38840/g.84763 Transcript_38840/m.84763 type:complete len:90 (-) Transcript_38840:135-404(-)